MVNIDEVVELALREIKRIKPDRTLIKDYLSIIREESYRDPLTRLRNRAYGERTLEQAKQESGKTNVPFSFYMLDVQGLREVNNLYSREIGDLLIQAATQFLSENSRRKDDLFKYGDSADEFGLILRKSNREGAQVYKQRIEEKLIDYKVKFKFKRKKIELPLRLHIGFSTYYPGGNLQTVIQEANEMMNKTKDKFH